MYYFTDLGIPHEVVIFLLKQEVWDKYFNDGNTAAFHTVVLGKSKATKPKIERITQEIIGMNNSPSYRLKAEDIYQMVLPNNDFILHTLPEQRMVYYDRDYCVYIELQHSNLKVPYKIYTPIKSFNFIDLVSRCKYITNGTMHGKFIYQDAQNFYQYRPEDYNLLENVRRVDLLADNKKTTSLKAGHIYIMKNKSKILYLGDLKECREWSRNFRIEYEHSFFNDNYSNVIYQNYLNQALYISLDTIDRVSYYRDLGLGEYIASQKGLKISEFIPKWIEFFDHTKEDWSRVLSYGCVTYNGGGIDEGKLLEDDNPDLCDILGAISLKNLENALKDDPKDRGKLVMYTAGLGTNYIKSLPNETKDLIFNELLKPDLNKMFKSVGYRVRPSEFEKILAENTSAQEILNNMKSLGLYYIEILDSLLNQKNSLGALLYSGRESELNTLIIESKKVNFKK